MGLLASSLLLGAFLITGENNTPEICPYVGKTFVNVCYILLQQCEVLIIIIVFCSVLPLNWTVGMVGVLSGTVEDALIT